MATRRRRGARTTLWALRLMLAGTAVSPAVEMPDLSGEWQLNKEASDDPETVMKEARSSGGLDGGYSGGGGMGRGGGGRHGGAAGGGGRGGGRGEPGDSSNGSPTGGFAALQTLRIRHEEPMVSITDAAGRESVLSTDGRKTEEERSRGGKMAVSASWKDGHLEVVSKPETGGKIVETYAVAADRSLLTVTTKVEGARGGSFTFHRVYDAVRPGAPKRTPTGPSRRAPTTPQPPAEDDGFDQSV